jgi:hypothetical protein
LNESGSGKNLNLP